MSGPVKCPCCGQPAYMVGPSGEHWRCYCQGEVNFSSYSEEARRAGRESQALSRANAAAMRERLKGES